MNVPSFCFKACASMGLSHARSFQYFRLHRGGLGSFSCSMREVLRSKPPRGARAPCRSYSCSPMSFLYVSKGIVPSSVRPYCVFLGDSNTKTQWAEVLGLLFSVAIIVMILAFHHVVRVLLWPWYLVHAALLDTPCIVHDSLELPS